LAAARPALDAVIGPMIELWALQAASFQDVLGRQPEAPQELFASLLVVAAGVVAMPPGGLLNEERAADDWNSARWDCAERGRCRHPQHHGHPHGGRR
jgi:hypothetical protein